MNSNQNTSIQIQIHIKAWTRLFHSRLTFQAKSQGKKDAEIPGIQLNIDTIQTTTNYNVACQYMSYNMQHHKMSNYNTSKNISSKQVREQRLNSTKYENILDILRLHAVIDGITLIRRCKVLPESLQRQALEQLHVNHMEIKEN